MVRIHGCGLERPTWLKRGDGPGEDRPVRYPTLGRTELPVLEAACSPVTAGAHAGRGADPSLGAGRLFASSDVSPELAISLTLRLPASCPDGSWGAPAKPLGAVLRLPAGTAGLFFCESAIPYSLRRNLKSRQSLN
jgi:hypothetical protein